MMRQTLHSLFQYITIYGMLLCVCDAYKHHLYTMTYAGFGDGNVLATKTTQHTHKRFLFH